MSTPTYPVHVEASLDSGLSRWLWLVKWLLVIPHLVVLFFLWIAFVAVSIAAFFAILVTGRYPRALFDFNVGVLRWTWRVQYYTYGALGTDRYPPFTLHDTPDYPAHLDVSYPEHLSRGLVLVKWWLLALPHYLVVALFAGGSAWVATGADNARWGFGGLIGILVLVAAVVLAVTGRYPRSIYDFVLGMNRWVLRVAAYAALMTDAYPPFRMDLGGQESGATLTVPTAAADRETAVTVPDSGARPPRRGWTAGRVVAVVAGSLLLLISLTALAGGGTALGFDKLGRDGGYLDTGEHLLSSGGYAVQSDDIDLSTGWGPANLLGTVRIRATSTDPTRRVFVGIGPTDLVDHYLAGVRRTQYSSLDTSAERDSSGTAPATTPTASRAFSASVAGTGTQTLTWPATSGHWTVVAMNGNGSTPVAVRADLGATVPDLPWFATGLLVFGALTLAGGLVLIIVTTRRAGRR